MAAMAQRRLLSLDEAVNEVVEAALAGRAVADSAAEVAHLLDHRDSADAIRTGIAEMAHRRLARQRRGASEEDGAANLNEVDTARGPVAVPPAAAKPHAAKEVWSALTANYEGADGTRKALRDFTLEDALHLRSQSNARADGFVRVRDAMDRAIGALRKHKVNTIGDLPAAATRLVAEGLS
jgi:hypothetical protein